jgi:hypothetical protein
MLVKKLFQTQRRKDRKEREIEKDENERIHEQVFSLSKIHFRIVLDSSEEFFSIQNPKHVPDFVPGFKIQN